MSSHGMSEGWPRHRPGLRGLKIAGMAVMGVVGAAVFALAFGWLVMILWNWVMPPIFHLGEITYWQGFGLVILGKLIFGGFGFRGGPHGRGPWKGGHWKGNPWGGNPWEGRRHGPDEWRMYREYWESEGRQAFDTFVEKKKAETPSEPKDV
jgi:hypothetical protein